MHESYFSSLRPLLKGKASGSNAKSSAVDTSGGMKSKVTNGIMVLKKNSTFAAHGTDRLGNKKISWALVIMPSNLAIAPAKKNDKTN